MTALYCGVDYFWKYFKSEWDKHLIALEKSNRGPVIIMSSSEMMTIVILFHQSDYRTFKHFYEHVAMHLRKEFPQLLSYSRFVHKMKELFLPLFAYLLHRRGTITGIAFIDSTSLIVCHNKRIRRNKVFKNLAKRGKTTAGWFYGFKLHLIINDMGEILAFQLTQGHIADIAVAETLTQDITGKMFGDKGYISSSLGKKLLERGLQLFTTIRANMKQKLMNLQDKILLRKRSIIETVNDQLKNISQIEHTRHRSPQNFLVNLLAGVAAYTHQPKKPSLKLDSIKNGLVLA
ncbi:MAG: IS982 family transposase [Simkaniaceae bacterium]|nr:IS982 family transposase [Simkaniaceae bacterium]